MEEKVQKRHGIEGEINMIDEKKLIEEIEDRLGDWEDAAGEYRRIGDEEGVAIYERRAVELKVVLKKIQKQPKVGEWIPSSERLPETDDVVLITVFNIDNNKLFVTPAVYQHPFFCTWNTLAPEDKVIAWQPLPEPWEGE